MEFNNKKLEKTSKLINVVISITLCVFLILFSNKLIGDVDNWKTYPTVESFKDKNLITKNDSIIDGLDEKVGVESAKIERINSTITIIHTKYQKSKNSFDTWLSAREVIGSPSEDNEIIIRANELDKLDATEQEWKDKRSVIQYSVDSLFNLKKQTKDLINTENSKAYDLLDIEIQAYKVRIFLIRLMIVIPILLLGLYFLFKLRKHKFWPLFLGFILFSFYTFFIGLVPYLPAYGGYIRYTVGIVVCIILGRFIINKIRLFIERKKSELKKSSHERAKHVEVNTAEKALDNHMCPSCGKDFIVVGWDWAAQGKHKPIKSVLITNYCRFCGLQLFKTCKSCDTSNFAHLPFCSNCGDAVNS